MNELSGVVVLECASLLPGPYCGAILRAYGARVIKIEPPSGDQLRQMQPDMWDVVNAGKESVVLDLKDEQGQEVLTGLLGHADVLLTSFRKRAQQRLGIDSARIKERAPELVHVSLAGFRDENDPRPGHDINYLAEAGVVELFGLGRDADSAILSVQTADLSGALMAALAVVTRLHSRSRGVPVEPCTVSLEDAVVAITRPRVAEIQGQADREIDDVISKPGYGTFRTADGQWVAIAALEDRLWWRLVELLGLGDLDEELASLPYPERCRRVKDVNAMVEEAVARVESSVLLEPRVAEEIAASPVRPLGTRARHLDVPGAGGLGGVATEAPALGEHTARLLEEMGVERG